MWVLHQALLRGQLQHARRGYRQSFFFLLSYTPDPSSSWLSAAPRAAQYFRDVDDALERAEEAHVAMEEAVAGERFADAARLRAELGALEERDSLSRVLRARHLWV